MVAMKCFKCGNFAAYKVYSERDEGTTIRYSCGNCVNSVADRTRIVIANYNEKDKK